MTLASIINPPPRVRFVIGGQGAPRETILGGLLPTPTLSTFTGTTPGENGLILEIDATVRQNHRISQSIPQHPVEEGFEISDDVQPKPKTLVLDCIISDIPPQILAAFAQPILDLINGNTRSSSAWTVLKGLVGEMVDGSTLQPELLGQPFDVVTSLDVYKSMLVEDINLNRSQSTGESISFSISLRQVRIVSSVVGPDRANAPIGANPDSVVGRSGTSPASETNSNQASGLATAVNQ